MKIKTRMLLAKKRFLKAIAKRKFITAKFTCKNCGCVISIKEELPFVEKPTYYTMKYSSFDYCSECMSKYIIEDNDLFYVIIM